MKTYFNLILIGTLILLSSCREKIESTYSETQVTCGSKKNIPKDSKTFRLIKPNGKRIKKIEIKFAKSGNINILESITSEGCMILPKNRSQNISIALKQGSLAYSGIPENSVKSISLKKFPSLIDRPSFYQGFLNEICPQVKGIKLFTKFKKGHFNILNLKNGFGIQDDIHFDVSLKSGINPQTLKNGHKIIYDLKLSDNLGNEPLIKTCTYYYRTLVPILEKINNVPVDTLDTEIFLKEQNRAELIIDHDIDVDKINLKFINTKFGLGQDFEREINPFYSKQLNKWKASFSIPFGQGNWRVEGIINDVARIKTKFTFMLNSKKIFNYSNEIESAIFFSNSLDMDYLLIQAEKPEILNIKTGMIIKKYEEDYQSTILSKNGNFLGLCYTSQLDEPMLKIINLDGSFNEKKYLFLKEDCYPHSHQISPLGNYFLEDKRNGKFVIYKLINDPLPHISKIQEIPNKNTLIEDITFSPDEKFLTFIGDNGLFKIYENKMGKYQEITFENQDECTSKEYLDEDFYAFSPDSNFMATTSNGQVCFFNLKNKKIQKLNINEEITSLHFSKMNTLLMSSKTKSILYEAPFIEKNTRTISHNFKASEILISPYDNFLLVIMDDRKSISILGLDKGGELDRIFYNHKISSVEFNPRNPTMIVTKTEDGTVHLSEIKGRNVLQGSTIEKYPKTWKFSPSKNKLAIRTDRKLKIINIETLKTKTFKIKDHDLYGFLPNEEKIYVIHKKKIRIIDVSTREEIVKTLPFMVNKGVPQFTISPNGKKILFWNENEYSNKYEILIYEIEKNSITVVFDSVDIINFAIQLDPKTILISSFENGIYTINSNDRTIIDRISKKGFELNSAVWPTKNSPYILLSSTKSGILYDKLNKKRRKIFRFKKSFKIKFTPDHKNLLIGDSSKKQVKLFNIKSKKYIFKEKLNLNEIKSISFSPNEKLFTISSNEFTEVRLMKDATLVQRMIGSKKGTPEFSKDSKNIIGITKDLSLGHTPIQF